MVSSSFFIVFEFIREFYTPLDLGVFTPYDLFIWGGAAMLMAAGALLLKNSRGTVALFVYAILICLGIYAAVMFGATVFSLTHNTLEHDASAFLGWDIATLYSNILMLCTVLVCVVSYGLSRFVSSEPSNDSKINIQQRLIVVAVVSGVLCAGTVLYVMSYEVFFTVMVGILLVTELLSIAFWLYDPLISLLSNILPSRSSAPLKPTPGRANHFAIIICAHNEEQVLEYLLESLLNMNYPKGKYDLYVVCDNCSDDTANIAIEQGAHIILREEGEARGKNEALRHAFNVLRDEQSPETTYDAYVVLNADNLVNETFLAEINTHLNLGHEIMQCYLGSKNPEDTLVSTYSSMAFWIENITHEEARSRMGLSAAMSGTGTVIRPSVLEMIPWRSDCLTEELAFGVKYQLETNQACHWVHSAILYDERPLTLKASVKQRTRWMQGRMDTLFRFGPKLLREGIKKRSFKNIDTAIYLFKPVVLLFAMFIYAIRTIFYILLPESVFGVPLVMDFPIALMLALASLLAKVYALSCEGYLRYAPWLPVQYLYNCLWFVPALRGFLKRNERFWVSTYHARALTIEDITEDVELNEARRRLSGLDNLHQLPIGQILLKAAIISVDQLNESLALQKRQGGYLGNILVDNDSISEDTLMVYIDIQQSIRESAHYDHRRFHTLKLGEILLNAHLITAQQFEDALERQTQFGGHIGESMVALGFISYETLSIFLEVQKIMDSNYLNEENAYSLIDGMAHGDALSYDEVEKIILSTELISQHQFDIATNYHRTSGKDILESIVELGFLSVDTVETLRRAFVLSSAPVTDSPASKRSDGGEAHAALS